MIIILYILGAVIATLSLLAVLAKPSSVYKNQPEACNPMEGKIVRFVEDESEPTNADGVCGHLESVGTSSHHP